MKALSGQGPEDTGGDWEKLLDEIDNDAPYESFIPKVPIERKPANCSACHPTDPRFVTVTVTRFMHQVEKKRKHNKSNVKKGVHNDKYIVWQFMPDKLALKYLADGDKFFETELNKKLADII